MKAMVGVDDVAEQVMDHLTYLQYEREEQARSGKTEERAPEHFIISGNPGTGKTQLATILAEAMAGIDPNRASEIAEFSASQLSGASYIGDAVKMINDFVEANPGKVIFIDEAHTLADKNTYGRDVLRAIIPMMTKKGRNAPQFIFAGYPETERVLGDLDPGFESRISTSFPMKDYDTGELTEIARRKLTGDPLGEGADAALSAAVAQLPVFERGKQEKFANGRGVERLMDNTRKAHGLRIQRARNAGVDSSEIDFSYTVDDVVDGFNRLKIGPMSPPKRPSAARKPAAAAPKAAPKPSGALQPVPATDESYFGGASRGTEPRKRRRRSTI